MSFMSPALDIQGGMGVDSFVVSTGTGDHVMKATVKRYRPTITARRTATEPGYILLFAHGVGFHKEQWEPVIQRLFEVDRLNHNTSRILEAWAIDYQSHGRAALLNKELFEGRPDLLPSVREYGEAFATLYWSGHLGEVRKGVQKLVLIGHSAGAIGCVFATSYFSTKDVPFESIIMVDPAWFGPNGNEFSKMYKIAEKTTPARRYQWESKDAAYNWMKTRLPWKAWDPRILKIYTDHGLHPATNHEDGVELVCNPLHEAAAFSAIPDHDFLNKHLRKITRVIPVYLAFGSRSDLFSREIQNSLHDPSAGHMFESVTRIEGAGHLVLQEKPDRVTDYIYDILRSGRNMRNTDAPNSRL